MSPSERIQNAEANCESINDHIDSIGKFGKGDPQRKNNEKAQFRFKNSCLFIININLFLTVFILTYYLSV